MATLYTFNIPVGTTGNVATFTITNRYTLDEEETYKRAPRAYYKYRGTEQWGVLDPTQSDVDGVRFTGSVYDGRHGIAIERIRQIGQIKCYENTMDTAWVYTSFHETGGYASWGNMQTADTQTISYFVQPYGSGYVRSISECEFSTNIPIFQTVSELNTYLTTGEGLEHALNYHVTVTPVENPNKLISAQLNLLRRRMMSLQMRPIAYENYFNYSIVDGYARVYSMYGDEWFQQFRSRDVYIPDTLENYPVQIDYVPNVYTYPDFFEGFRNENFSVTFGPNVSWYHVVQSTYSRTIFNNVITKFFAYPNFNSPITLPNTVFKIETLFMPPNTRLPYSNFNSSIVIPEGVEDVSQMFRDARHYNQETIFPSTLKAASYAFNFASEFNQNVIFPDGIFASTAMANAHSFNYPIRIPENSHISLFFWNCRNLNQPFYIPQGRYISWNWQNNNFYEHPTYNLYPANGMFRDCFNMNSPVTFNEAVGDLRNFFMNCYNYNQPVTLPVLPNVNTAAIDTQQYPMVNGYMPTERAGGLICGMFLNCNNFNQPITVPDKFSTANDMLRGCKNMRQPVVLGELCSKINNICYDSGVHDLTIYNKRLWIGARTNFFGTGSYTAASGRTPITFNPDTGLVDDYGVPMYQINIHSDTYMMYSGEQKYASDFFTNATCFSQFFGPAYANGIRSFTLTDWGDSSHIVGYYKNTPESENYHSIFVNFI